MQANVFVGLGIALMFGTVANAQPLVTGDLSIYYSFDEFVDEVEDGSGNNFNGSVVADDGSITNDTANSVRGGGSALFQQVLEQDGEAAFIDLDGVTITNDFFDFVPQETYTVAAWVNTPGWDAQGDGSFDDQSVFQSRSADGSFVHHFQLQGNGQFRSKLRGQLQSTGISSNEKRWTDGNDDGGAGGPAFPLDEWFHYATTYDATADDGNGEWTIYYNGQLIASEIPDNPVPLGDWGGLPDEDLFTAGIGAVMDGGSRRFDGNIDEFYIFTRALAADEIETLFNVNPGNPGCPDGSDPGMDCSRSDIDMNGTVGFSDFVILSNDFGKDSPHGAAAGVANIPEPASLCLLGLGSLLLLARRRR